MSPLLFYVQNAAIVLACWLIASLFLIKGKKAKKGKINSAFEGLRTHALSMTPEKLLISLPEETTVYGIVMDREINGGIATIVSYQTGDASLYLSWGGGIIGGGKYRDVKEEAKKFVQLAQGFLKHTTQTSTTPLPRTNQIIFYLLTNKGVFTGNEYIQNFENNSSLRLTLFEEGNHVLTKLRLADMGK